MGSISSISSGMPFDLTMEQERHVSTVCCSWLHYWQLRSVRTIAWMVTLSDVLHNFVDGLVIGTSFVVSVLSGVNISIAIMCEEIPHELGQWFYFSYVPALCC
ncbi:zinc transporter ZIP8-like [Arapaima gigas]